MTQQLHFGAIEAPRFYGSGLLPRVQNVIAVEPFASATEIARRLGYLTDPITGKTSHGPVPSTVARYAKRLTKAGRLVRSFDMGPRGGSGYALPESLPGRVVAQAFALGLWWEAGRDLDWEAAAVGLDAYASGEPLLCSPGGAGTLGTFDVIKVTPPHPDWARPDIARAVWATDWSKFGKVAKP